MKYIYTILLTGMLFVVNNVIAEDENKSSGVAAPGSVELTEDELKNKIGRMGEVEEIPEGFEFTEAENLMWRSDHLSNIKEPANLYYEFEQSGVVADGFTDSVYLRILELNEDGSKNAQLDFFTASRKQAVRPDNVTGIYGNPVLGIYMGGDMKLMQQITEGSWRHFQKLIKVSLREDAVVEQVNFSFNGKDYQGKKVSFQPFVEDIHRRKYDDYADKSYEFIFSDEIPGSLYQIKTIVPSKSQQNTDPLILEVLTLVDVKNT
ncbi:MAG: hypothetical protein AAF410_02225 [Pseudomonadota bacterium]